MKKNGLQLPGLIKAGYSVKIGYRVIPGNTKGKKEYIVEYWEKGEE